MTTPLDPRLLARLYRILRQQEDLNSRIRKCPVAANLARKTEEQLETSLAEARELLKKTRMAADQKQLQLSEREARIDDLKGKRNACDSNREYQLLTDQIAADQQANSVQSDEILELLERIDSVEADVENNRTGLERAKNETRQIQSDVDAQLRQLESDRDAVSRELAEVEARLPTDVRDAYRRMVESVGEDAIAPVDDNSCGHCNTTQTTQVVSELMMNHPVFCKSCGSLMYLADNAAV